MILPNGFRTKNTANLFSMMKWWMQGLSGKSLMMDMPQTLMTSKSKLWEGIHF